MNNAIVDKIKKIRISKGFKHDDMADKLNITRSAYQRLESGETYSWAKYLEELMDIFETTPNEFFSDIGKRIINQTNQSGSIGYVVENLQQENKTYLEKIEKLHEIRAKEKDDQIAFLKAQVEKLMG